MQKYLVTKVTNFYDGHGEPKSGNCEKFISNSPIFDIIEDGDMFGAYSDLENYTPELIKEYEITKYNYKDTVEEYYADDAELYTEDGYHCKTQSYYFKQITDEQAIHIQYILDEYAKL